MRKETLHMYMQPCGPVDEDGLIWLCHEIGCGWQKTLGLAKCFVI